jgi:hypothetical protein
MLLKTRKSKDILSNKELAEIQQPLAKDGYSNDNFDKLYGNKTKNPFWNSERDRKKRKRIVASRDDQADNCPRCGQEKPQGMKYCFKCLD